MPVDEPLALSAPLQWAEAQHACAEDCRAYHGVWQYLRLLGVISSIRADSGYLLAALRDLARAGATRRVLISGTADYGMLAHVLAALRAEGVSPEVTVLDLCPTPLAMNGWYAERAGLEIRTVRQDALSFTDDSGFDLICTHSFLGRFHPAQQQALVSRWLGLLRPGGHVLTSKRIRPDHPSDTVTYDDADVARFDQRLISAIEQRGLPHGIHRQALLATGREYARSRHNHNFRSADELASLFDHGGFELVDLDSPDALPGDQPAVVRQGRSQRVRLLARRPN